MDSNAKVSKQRTKKPRKPGSKIRVCLDWSRYPVTEQAAMELGYKPVGLNFNFDVMWMDRTISPDFLRGMPPGARINHWPGMECIFRKDTLGITLNRMATQFPDEYNFFPVTYLLPADLHRLRPCLNGHTIYISKPQASAQGKGIFLFTKLSDIDPYSPQVVQKYITNPLLLRGYKFDLRVYCLVDGLATPSLYLYSDGLVRCATEPYSKPNTKNIGELYMHLTNYAINKTNPTFHDALRGLEGEESGEVPVTVEDSIAMMYAEYEDETLDREMTIDLEGDSDEAEPPNNGADPSGRDLTSKTIPGQQPRYVHEPISKQDVGNEAAGFKWSFRGLREVMEQVSPGNIGAVDQLWADISSIMIKTVIAARGKCLQSSGYYNYSCPAPKEVETHHTDTCQPTGTDPLAVVSEDTGKPPDSQTQSQTTNNIKETSGTQPVFPTGPTGGAYNIYNQNYPPCYELLGFDIMVLENKNFDPASPGSRRFIPKLLEVNHLPSLNSDTHIDRIVKLGLLKWVLRTVSSCMAPPTGSAEAATAKVDRGMLYRIYPRESVGEAITRFTSNFTGPEGCNPAEELFKEGVHPLFLERLPDDAIYERLIYSEEYHPPLHKRVRKGSTQQPQQSPTKGGTTDDTAVGSYRYFLKEEIYRYKQLLKAYRQQLEVGTGRYFCWTREGHKVRLAHGVSYSTTPCDVNIPRVARRRERGFQKRLMVGGGRAEGNTKVAGDEEEETECEDEGTTCSAANCGVSGGSGNELKAADRIACLYRRDNIVSHLSSIQRRAKLMGLNTGGGNPKNIKYQLSKLFYITFIQPFESSSDQASSNINTVNTRLLSVRESGPEFSFVLNAQRCKTPEDKPTPPQASSTTPPLTQIRPPERNAHPSSPQVVVVIEQPQQLNTQLKNIPAGPAYQSQKVWHTSTGPK